jgi:FkbM family methyltransferase
MAGAGSELQFERRGRGWLTALVVLLAGVWAGYNAWTQQQDRTLPLDLDGWGCMVDRLQENGCSFASLFTAPSLWKGPVVPFVFGLCYYVAPWNASVLVINVLFFSLGAGLVFAAFCDLGANRWVALAAILLWVFYLPHRVIFAYYYAEPLLALLSAGLFWLAGRMTLRPKVATALAMGLLAGVLVLARAPFLLIVLGLPLVLWRLLKGMRFRVLAVYGAGFFLAFAPWPIRNYLVEGEFIPFTTEGGKILFQGTYLPGDDVGMSELRKQSAFQEMEAREGQGAMDQYRYWRSLAFAQVREDPLGQIELCLRKALRFWMYLPAHSWALSWKTGALALIALPLAAFGAWSARRRPLTQLCVLWAAGLWLFHALVHSELRYNFPVLPMLLLLAAIGIQYVGGNALFVRIRDGISWRWRLWRRRRFLLKHFQNGLALANAFRSKARCNVVVCKDGTRLTRPTDRDGFLTTLVEIWHERAYTPPGFYRPMDSDVVIDAGANVGLFTIWLARQNPYCRIFALEPFNENFEHLRGNLAAAHAQFATACPLALGGTSGRRSMISVGSRSLDHRLSANDAELEGGEHTPVVTVADLFDLSGAARIALLKLDIEGTEYEVFERLRREDLIRIDRLAIEFHEHLRPGTRELLASRLSPTHNVIVCPDPSGLYGMIFAAIRRDLADR